MTNKMSWIKRTALTAVMALYCAGDAVADFLEAPRSHMPGQSQTIVMGSKKGNLEKTVVKQTVKYKSDKVYAAVSVPYVHVENCEAGIDKQGVGDLEVEVGKPLKFGDTHVMPLVNCKLPTGEDEVCGDQYEVGAELATTTIKGKTIFNLGVGYTHKTEGEDQYFVRCTPAYNLGSALKGNWKVGIENVAVFDKDSETFTIRPLVRYTAKGGTHITAGPGVTVENGEKLGYDIGIRVRIPLGKK